MKIKSAQHPDPLALDRIHRLHLLDLLLDEVYGEEGQSDYFEMLLKEQENLAQESD